MTMSTPSVGFLRVVGESHYQAALSAAKDSSTDDQPVFVATLIPEPSNTFDANAVIVAIEPFGQIGYLARDSAKRYVSSITSDPPVRCPVQLRGTSPFIGAVVDVTRSEGARLTAWRPDEKYDYEANSRFHQMRKAALDELTATRLVERSDVASAISRYQEALDIVRSHQRFAVEHNLFPLLKPGTNMRDVEVLDRLTLCLVRAGRHDEAVSQAQRYFDEFPDAAATSGGKVIASRTAKAKGVAERGRADR